MEHLLLTGRLLTSLACNGPPGAMPADLTSCLPMWLAPNLITLTGVFGLVVAFAVSACYLPEYEGMRAGGAPPAAVVYGPRS